MKEIIRMNEESETSIDRMFSEEIEAIIALLEDPEILDYYTLLSGKELEWTKETLGTLSRKDEAEVKYRSYKMSPKERKEVQKAKNYHKNMKSKVKAKAFKECMDLSRLAWIHREYSDDALKEMFPSAAIEHIVKTLVFRFGYDHAVVIASAIESGLMLSQIAALPEYPEMFEISVPITIRVKTKEAGMMSFELWKRAFERFAEKQASEQETH
jgi:hypothetical protein